MMMNTYTGKMPVPFRGGISAALATRSFGAIAPTGI
jgi:hypothetical protein